MAEKKNKLWTIARIWKAELLLALLLALLFLAIDLRIYTSLVKGNGVDQAKLGNVLLLKKPLLEATAKRIAERDEFFKNPTYPLTKDPF